jgi:signal peptidase I
MTAAAVLVCVVAAVLVHVRMRYLLITVDGQSMAPTLVTGDRLLVRRTVLTSVRKGQMVVVCWSGSPNELMVKRAVAVPGDAVPRGIPVTERTVPAGKLVVLGDNVDHSFDSRRAGFLSAAEVVGVVVRPRSMAVY